MSKKQAEKNQITSIIVGLIVAIAIIVICGKALITEVNSDKGNDNEITSSVNSIQSEIDSITQEEINITEVQTDNTEEEILVTQNTYDNNLVSAKDCLGMSGTEIKNKLSPDYEDLGVIDGGYTIADNSVYPNLQFIVNVDENNEILDTPITNIVALESAKIDDNLFVGMNYYELKKVLGDKIKPIESDEENCMFALIEQDDYTATVEFEYSGGKSIKALIKAK